MRALSVAASIMAGLMCLPAVAQTQASWRTIPPAGYSADHATDWVMTALPIIRVADQRSAIVPSFPGPALGEDATPQDYLRAAQGALAAGRTREAQQALEMAQTRMLDRSVPYGQTNNPSENPGVERVSQALRALTAGDRAGCMSAIQAALSAP